MDEMRKWVVGLAVVLAACSGGTEVDLSGEGAAFSTLSYKEVTLPDGRVIPCILYAGPNAGGLSCDWNAR